MQHINSADELITTISELKQKLAFEEQMIKEQSRAAYDSLKPANLIRSAVNDVATTPDLQDRLINATAALVAGSLSNLIFQGVSHSPLKKLVGVAIQFGVTKIIVDNPQVVKAIGLGIYNLITHKSRKENRRMQYTDTK